MTNDIKYRLWLSEQLGRTTIKNLKHHGFNACFAVDAKEARQLVLKEVSKDESFGFGGSSTTRALGLPEILSGMGKTVYDHWNPGKENSDLDLRLAQGRCDCFICGANAISATGEIVNVDGVGNRVCAMIFGCPRVVIIAGMNKVRKTLDSALARIREIAGPMRAKSLNMDTPCAKTGICVDCDSPQRICCVTAILHRKPMMTDVSVILVNSELGF
ncbi:MAG: lactate utilization protein [Deltaproteobacteria bacterium]|nr:lactate utilization protein [Deltaproteobacteria bacterium]